MRVAAENARLNQIPGIDFSRKDVTKWTPRKKWDVVAANLFSEVLIRAAPGHRKGDQSGGWLIFSGVMRHQEKECVAAFACGGFPREENHPQRQVGDRPGGEGMRAPE